MTSLTDDQLRAMRETMQAVHNLWADCGILLTKGKFESEPEAGEESVSFAIVRQNQEWHAEID